jgi:hypothetical protein
MKKIFLFSFIAAILLSTSGCNKDYLNVEPTQFLTEQQIQRAAENNPDVIAGSLSGIYTLMFQTGTGGTNLAHYDFGQKGYDIFSDMLSGDMALSVNTYGWYRRLTELTATSDYTRQENYIVWRYYYRIIRAANSVIFASGGNDVVPANDNNKAIMGQAKALRAYAYFYLTQFEQKSYNPSEEILPIYIDPAQQNQPKSTAQDVYDLMIKDLTDAISLLENFNRTSKNEVNKYVAEGLLSYVYGAMGGTDNYTKAKNLTNDIITAGGFPLTTQTEVAYSGNGAIGGFNDVNTPSWMWGQDITLDNGLDLVSWWGQMDVFTYSYAWAGDAKAIDEGLYNSIPSNDIRKGQFYSNPSSYYYLMPLYKFYDPNRQIGGQRNITTDYIYMRVDEMYLLNAEMAAKSGDEATAKLRLKALLNLRIPDASYVDGLSGQALLDEIYLQTRIELWGEGKSYLAMKRNQATITRGANWLSHVGEAIPYDDPRLTFEIPQSEIQNNPFIN